MTFFQQQKFIGLSLLLCSAISQANAALVLAPPSNLQDGLAETLQTYQYQHQDGQQVITTRRFAYDKHGERMLGKRVKQQRFDGITGQQLSTQDSQANRVNNDYDGLGRLRSVQYLASDDVRQQTTISYHLQQTGMRKTTHYPDQQLTASTQFDALGRQIATYDSAHGREAVTQTVYNDLGQVQEKINHLGIAKQLTYNAQGQVVKSQLGVAGQLPVLTIYHQHDAVKNTLTDYAQGQDGQTTARQIQYLNAAQQTIENSIQLSLTAQRNNFAKFDNFSQQQQTDMVREDSHRRLTHYHYDALGQLTSTQIDAEVTSANVTPDMPLKITLQHDFLGKVTTRTLSSAKTSITRERKTYTMDGQLITQQLLGGKGGAKTAAASLTKTYDYNLDGDLSTIHDWQLTSRARGDYRLTLSNQYRSVLGKHRLTAVHIPAYQGQAGYRLMTQYSPTSGRIIETYKVMDKGGVIDDDILYNYDAATGQLRQKIYNHKQSIGYRYDSAGRLTSLTNPMGYITRFTYQGKLKQLTRATTYQADGIHKIAAVAYDYDSLQRLWHKYRYRFSATNQAIAVDRYDYTYDKENQLTDVWHQLSNLFIGNRVERMHYAYNADNSLCDERYSQQGDSEYRDQRYVYDNLKRLVQSTIVTHHRDGTQTGKRTDYQFDMNNNRIAKQVSDANGGQFYHYNALDQLSQTQAISYARESGDLLSDGSGYHYTYDALHKLINLRDNTHVLAHYTYGSDGMRLRKTGKDAQGQPIILHYFYDRDNLLATQSDEKAGHNTAFYLIGKTREVRIVKQRGKLTLSFYGVDRHSISSTINVNETGTQTTHYYTYNDYGQANSHAATALSINYDPYRGLNEYSEQESQGRLQYRPARELNLAMQQFTSLDTDNRGNNRYAYAAANPISNIDPTGNVSWTSIFYGLTGLTFAGKARGRYLRRYDDHGCTEFLHKFKFSFAANLLMTAFALVPDFIQFTDGDESFAQFTLAAVPLVVGMAVGSVVGFASQYGSHYRLVSAAMAPYQRVLSAGIAGVLGLVAAEAAECNLIKHPGLLRNYGFDKISQRELVDDKEKARWAGFIFAAGCSWEGWKQNSEMTTGQHYPFSTPLGSRVERLQQALDMPVTYQGGSGSESSIGELYDVEWSD